MIQLDRSRRVLGATVLGIGILLSGCAESSAPVSTPATSVSEPEGDIGVICESLLAIDAVPLPDSDGVTTDPATNAAFSAAVGPHLATARAVAPAELAASLDVLAPVVAAMKDGSPMPDDDVLLAAFSSYEAWAHAECGYQNVDVMAMDYEYQGVPATLAAGPTSFSLMNHSERGEFHTAVLAKLRPGLQLTLEQLWELSVDEIADHADVVPGFASAAPGATGGTLVTLTPGHYFLVCPIPSDENDPASAHLSRGMLTEFHVT